MRFLPILFSTPMIRAILDGRKMQTRRIKYKCDVGDVLWVRETFFTFYDKSIPKTYYKADNPVECKTWKPNIFMPRKACRLFLQVEVVREERLQEISAADIEEEGISGKADSGIMRQNFQKLWDSINAKRGYGWDSNPIVKVIEFRVLKDFCGEAVI